MNGKVVKNSMYRLAEMHGAAVWDLYSIMGGLGSIPKWRNSGLAQRDLIHLTGKGYRLVGDLFTDAFIRRYDSLKDLP